MHPSPPPPMYSLLLSSVFSRQQGLLGGIETFFLSSNEKLISTEIRDKQAKLKPNSNKVAKFLSKSTMLSDNSKFNNEGIGALVIVKATKGATDTILYSEHAIKIGNHNGQGEVDSYQTSEAEVCVAQVLSSICLGKATSI